MQPRKDKPEMTARANKPRPIQNTAAVKPLSNRSVRHFRSLLQKERDRLLYEKERLRARTARHDARLQGGPESQYDDHMADIATETQDREIDLASSDSVDEILDQIAVALAKIETKTYGICDVCTRPICRARLKALPYAALCIECQSIIEG